MWDIVWVSPQGHRSVSVSRHFLLRAPQCSRLVRKRFSRALLPREVKTRFQLEVLITVYATTLNGLQWACMNHYVEHRRIYYDFSEIFYVCPIKHCICILRCITTVFKILTPIAATARLRPLQGLHIVTGFSK